MSFIVQALLFFLIGCLWIRFGMFLVIKTNEKKHTGNTFFGHNTLRSACKIIVEQNNIFVYPDLDQDYTIDTKKIVQISKSGFFPDKILLYNDDTGNLQKKKYYLNAPNKYLEIINKNLVK